MLPSRALFRVVGVRALLTHVAITCSRWALPSSLAASLLTFLQVGRFKFYNESAPFETPCGAAAEGIPYTCEVQVTPKLIEYIEEHALEVEIFGERFPAVVQAEGPLYDNDNRKLRGVDS